MLITGYIKIKNTKIKNFILFLKYNPNIFFFIILIKKNKSK